MKKETNVLSNLKNYPLLILFCILLFGMSIYDSATPDIESSQTQNKDLEQMPVLDFSKFTSFEKASDELKDFCNDFNTNVKEQVAFSDGLIESYGFFETAIFQKNSLGGILLGDDDMMFVEAFDMLATEETNYPHNLNALDSLASEYGDKLSVIIAPTATLVYPENLPANVPLLDTGALIDETLAIAQNAGANVIDVRQTLGEHSDEYIYYRTDHHWTTLGAYYAYEAYCESRGLTPFDVSTAESVSVENFYGTHYAKARIYDVVPDVLTYYPLENQMTVYQILAEGKLGEGTAGDLYTYEKFDQYDKYGAFLQGNNGFSRIEGDGEGSILVVKDSYANSLVPFLTANYATIDVLDYRSYSYGIDPLIEQNGYDDILLLYNIDTFKGDAAFRRVGVRG